MKPLILTQGLTDTRFHSVTSCQELTSAGKYPSRTDPCFAVPTEEFSLWITVEQKHNVKPSSAHSLSWHSLRFIQASKCTGSSLLFSEKAEIYMTSDWNQLELMLLPHYKEMGFMCYMELYKQTNKEIDR